MTGSAWMGSRASERERSCDRCGVTGAWWRADSAGAVIARHVISSQGPPHIRQGAVPLTRTCGPCLLARATLVVAQPGPHGPHRASLADIAGRRAAGRGADRAFPHTLPGAQLFVEQLGGVWGRWQSRGVCVAVACGGGGRAGGHPALWPTLVPGLVDRPGRSGPRRAAPPARPHHGQWLPTHVSI